MNASNRALNRILLGLVGLIALAVTAAVVAMIVVPGFNRQWAGSARSVLATADDVFARPLWSGTRISVAALVALGAALVFVLLLAVFVLRHGRGGTSTVLSLHSPDGLTEIDTSVPAALLENLLTPVPGVAGVSVSAYQVHREPVLKVTVRCRRGASARTIANALDDAATRVQDVLGVPTPVFAQLIGGFRARLTPAVRVDTSTSTARYREHPTETHHPMKGDSHER
ncbi:MAG: hypothetical protein AAGC66_00270 [Leifsonia sp.]